MRVQIVLQQFFRAEMFFHVVGSNQSLLPETAEVFGAPGRIDMSPFLVRIRTLCIEILAGNAVPVIYRTSRN